MPADVAVALLLAAEPLPEWFVDAATNVGVRWRQIHKDTDYRSASTPARAAVGRSTTRRQSTVTSYTITIASDDDNTTSTTLRLEATNGGVTLTDVHLHAGNGLSTGALPALDYGLLLQAIAPTTPTPVLTATPPVPAIQSTPAPRNDSVTARRSTTTTAARTTGRPTTRRAAGKPAPAVAEPAAKPGTRRATTTTTKTSASTKKTTPPPASDGRAKKTVTATPAKKTASTATGTERVYRRMPADFAIVYQQAGGAAATAAHYGVPRHTANGWIRRLRDQDAAATKR